MNTQYSVYRFDKFHNKIVLCVTPDKETAEALVMKVYNKEIEWQKPLYNNLAMATIVEGIVKT